MYIHMKRLLGKFNALTQIKKNRRSESAFNDDSLYLDIKTKSSIPKLLVDLILLERRIL